MSTRHVRTYFDNGPVLRMQQEVWREVRRLNFLNCEVLEVRIDSFKAVIHVLPCENIPEQLEEKGFGVFQKAHIKILWRKPGE